MQVQPYLFFDGRCEEAIEFYRKVLGAEVQMLMRFKDGPEPQAPGMVPHRCRSSSLCSRLFSKTWYLMMSQALWMPTKSRSSAAAPTRNRAGRGWK